MSDYENQSPQKTSSPKSGENTHGDTGSHIKKPAVPVRNTTTDSSIQKMELPQDEELLQRRFTPVQRKEESPLQLQTKDAGGVTQFKPVQKKTNQTGLPDNLKSGVESLSGMNLSDVKVHYDSPQPSQYNALAYAQGTDIHIGSGQEQHLPHEAWHVAQQKQGRVQATTQMKGAGINDEKELEREADEMGAKALNIPDDSLASGHEHFNRSDIGQIKAQSTLVSTAQRQTLENINSEVSGASRKINHSQNSTVQRETITQLVAGKFLVDDGAPLSEGQQHKSTFLAALRADVKSVAKDILEPAGLAQNDCPDLSYWINYYQGKTAAYFEAAIEKYAPATAEAKNPAEFLSSLTERVKQGLVEHVATGSHAVEPGEVPKDIDAKRPDASILTIQKKSVAPIQFGLCSSTIQEPQETSDGKDEINQQAFLSAELIAQRARTLKDLYQRGRFRDAASALYEWHKQIPDSDLKPGQVQPAKKKIERLYPTLDDYIVSLEGCSAAAGAVSTYITGKDLEPKKDAPAIPGLMDLKIPLLYNPQAKAKEDKKKSAEMVPISTKDVSLSLSATASDTSAGAVPSTSIAETGESPSATGLDRKEVLALSEPPKKDVKEGVPPVSGAGVVEPTLPGTAERKVPTFAKAVTVSPEEKAAAAANKLRIEEAKKDAFMRIPFTLGEEFEKLLSNGNGFFYVRSEIGQIHHFSIVSFGGVYDIYESDDIPRPAINFLTEHDPAVPATQKPPIPGQTGTCGSKAELIRKFVEIIWRDRDAQIQESTFTEKATVRYKPF